MEPERALWWTFAGGQINHTLKYGIELQSDLKVIADNFRLKIEGTGLNFKSIENNISQMGRLEFWKDGKTQERIFQKLPEYRLSKFQLALPDIYAIEMIANFLLDVKWVVKYLNGRSDEDN